MNEVFKIILSLSCSGTLLILFFCLFRPLIRGRMSKQWQYYIWLAVVVRLLLPIALEPNLVGTFFQTIGNITQTKLVPLLKQEEVSAMINDVQEGNAIERERGGLQKEQSVAVSEPVLWPFWLVVALILFIRKITIYQSFVKYIKAGCVEVEDIRLLEHLGKQAEQSGVKATVEIYTNHLISSPLLIGFFRPCIVLPTDKLSDVEFQYTILHELTHYKRGDMFYKWLVQMIVCIHWFNPFVYLMSHKVEHDCELSCDEAVIRDLSLQERHVYGDTLLNAAGSAGRYKNAIASVTLSEGREQLQERLDEIRRFQKKSKPIAFVLAFVVCTGSLMMGAYASPESVASDKPLTIGDLTLIEKEYTISELKALDISNIIVSTLSEEVLVVRGEDTLKFEFYVKDPNEYRFEHVKFNTNTNSGVTLCVSRASAPDSREGRSITIRVPEQMNLGDFDLRTTSGDIFLTDCVADTISAVTQNGQIEIQGGAVSKHLLVNTKIGDALVSKTILPQSSRKESFVTNFETESGTIIFQPVDSKDNYSFHIDYGKEAEFFVNNEGYEQGYTDNSSIAETQENDNNSTIIQEVEPISGEPMDYLRQSKFTYNENGPTKVYFSSSKGTFMVQEK